MNWDIERQLQVQISLIEIDVPCPKHRMKINKRQNLKRRDGEKC